LESAQLHFGQMTLRTNDLYPIQVPLMTFNSVSEMTYTVSSGTFNSTIPYHTDDFQLVTCYPHQQPSLTHWTSPGLHHVLMHLDC